MTKVTLARDFSLCNCISVISEVKIAFATIHTQLTEIRKFALKKKKKKIAKVGVWQKKYQKKNHLQLLQSSTKTICLFS